jgi:ERF superfamily
MTNSSHTKAEEVGQIVSIPKAAATPMSLLQIAVEQGADIDKLEKLMALQERWEANEARKAYVVAMNAFKANPPDVFKSKQVSFNETSYKHALLSDAADLIGAALSVHGLSFRWDTDQLDGGMVKVTCIITHAQGHSERVTLQAGLDQSGKKNNIQALGSTVSYLQRYTLFSATGLAAKDQDDDSQGSEQTGMASSVLADFEAAIEALVDEVGAAALWKKIAAACKEAGDKANYKVLKDKIGKKVAAIKGGAK